MQEEIKEFPYNRSNYIIRRRWWIEHYMRLTNQEILKNKMLKECKTCGAGNQPKKQCKECNTLPSKG
jgi:ribosomal protein L32